MLLRSFPRVQLSSPKRRSHEHLKETKTKAAMQRKRADPSERFAPVPCIDRGEKQGSRDRCSAGFHINPGSTERWGRLIEDRSVGNLTKSLTCPFLGRLDPGLT